MCHLSLVDIYSTFLSVVKILSNATMQIILCLRIGNFQFQSGKVSQLKTDFNFKQPSFKVGDTFSIVVRCCLVLVIFLFIFYCFLSLTPQILKFNFSIMQNLKMLIEFLIQKKVPQNTILFNLLPVTRKRTPTVKSNWI